MGVSIVVLAVVGINARRELAYAKAASEQLEAECAKLSRENEDLLAKLPEAQDELAETVVKIASVAEAPIEEVASVEAGEPKDDSPKRMMRNMSKMLDNPAMNKMMVAAQRGALDVMYEDLAVQLKLTGEEKEHFMQDRCFLTERMSWHV